MKWPLATIGDLADFSGGGTPSKSNEEFYQGDIPWVTPKDMKLWDIRDAQDHITLDAIEQSAAKLLPVDTILIVVRSGILKHTLPVAINRVPVAINQDMKALRCRDSVLPEYLARIITAAEPIVLSWVRATTADNFPVENLKNLEIPLPPLDEQRRIAAILDQADALRRARRRALDRLNDLGQSIFYEMFGDPVSNPRNWPVLGCEELCDKITVGIVVQPASWYKQAGVPALRSLNIRPDVISMENLVYFSSIDNETKLTKTRIWQNDVVIVRTGQPGTAAVVPSHLNGANCIDLIIATPNSKKLEPLYLTAFLNSSAGKKLIFAEERGQIQKHFNIGALKNAKIPLPPIDQQQAYRQRILACREQIRKYELSLTKIESLFSSLQHLAFRGELTNQVTATEMRKVVRSA